MTVTDPDSASLAGATVSIVGNYASGDVLIFADQNDITGSYSNGVLMLTGNASVASYQSALQSITFASTNNSTATRTVSYVVNDGSLNSASATKLIDVFAPVDVTGVYVKCSTWNTTFLDDLATNGLGSSTLGFRMQTGANQLEPLPWNNLDTIEIVFSGAVNVSQNSLSLIGSPNQAHAPPSIAGFSYDATTHTATWSLSGSLNDNRLLLDLPAAGVTDSRGATLDGEFANTTTTPTVIGQAFPSGNGLSGGDFTFLFNVLPGDVNQDGSVNGLDVSLVAADWLNTGTVRSDTNGDNVVNGLDIVTIASNWLTTLPAGVGGAGGSEAATIMGGDAAVGSTASIATASSVLESPTVLASIATSASGTGTSSSGLVISTAPAFSSMQAADRLAAFIGWPDVTKVVATIDHVFSQGAGAEPSSRPVGTLRNRVTCQTPRCHRLAWDKRHGHPNGARRRAMEFAHRRRLVGDNGRQSATLIRLGSCISPGLSVEHARPCSLKSGHIPLSGQIGAARSAAATPW